MLNLKEQCPELLKQLNGFPNDGDGTHLEEIYNESKFWQTTLRTALGWEDDVTEFCVNPELNIEVDFEFSLSLIKSLLSEKDAEYITNNISAVFDNRLESGIKISKEISKRITSKEYVTRFASELLKFSSDENKFLRTLQTELSKFPKTITILQMLNDPSVFVQNFFSEIASTKNKTYGFTIDMFMFLRGCNSEAYTSCYTISRMYNSSAPISYANSGKVGMIFSKDDKQILGRCWVIFAPDFKAFSILKPYGFLSENIISYVASGICYYLDRDSKWYRIQRKDFDGDSLNVLMPNTGIYGDPLWLGYSTKTEVKKGNHVVLVPKDIDSRESMCVTCGKRIPTTTILCNECAEMHIRKCKKCGTVIYKPSNSNVVYCDTCAANFYTCPNCGQYVPNGEICSCQTAKTECEICGKSTDIIEAGTHFLCQECASILCDPNQTCSSCGAIGPVYPHKGELLCKSCLTKKYLS